MSINEKQQIKCPVCGELCEMDVWQSITADDSPDLKEDLLKGRANIFRCGECGHTALVPEPVLYRDSDKMLIISFSPCSDEGEKQRLLREICRASKESGELNELENYNMRFVTDYNSFLEKILIFDSGLNDKTIEVLKLLVLMQDSGKMSDRVCVFGKKDDYEIEFMVRDKKENQVYTSHVPLMSYNEVSKQLALSGVKDRSFNWELVDRNYAAELLHGKNNTL